MKTMPRLVDDQRRKRLVFSLASLVALSIAIVVCGLNVSMVNERWREEGLTLLREIECQSKWLGTDMNVPRDVEELAEKMKDVEEFTSIGNAIRQSDIDFAIGSRKAECQSQARLIADRCMALVAALAEDRLKMTSLLSEGTNIMSCLNGCAASMEARELERVQATSIRVRSELQDWCSRKWVLAFNGKSIIDRHCKFSSEIKEKIHNDRGWQKIEEAHSSYANWKNNLSSCTASWREKEGKLKEAYSELEQFPFDGVNAAKLTQQMLKEEIRRADAVLSVGADLAGSIQRRAEEMLERDQAAAKSDYNTLLELQKVHGTFVAASSVTSALQYVESFQPLIGATQKSISARVATLRNCLAKSAESKKVAERILLSIGRSSSDDGIISSVCKTGQLEVRKLAADDVALKMRIESLTNHIASVQKETTEKMNHVSEILRSVKQSFPDWRTEGNRLISEFGEIRRDVAAVRVNASSLQKSFVTYRDNEAHKTMMGLHKRLDKIFDMLKTIEEACSGLSPCTSGVEMSALTQRRDKAKKLVELVSQRVEEMSKDVECAKRDGTLRKIRFVTSSTRSVAEQLQQGVRHFDLALDIPNGGHHQIEVRFVKGGRSLYKVSPYRKHKIIMRCAISGVVKKEVDLSWEDMTSGWHEGVMLEGDFSSGVNDINIDMVFNVQDSKNEVMRDGVWQYQYDNGFFSKSMQDNFGVEFWLDGIKKNVLWGESEL